MMEKTTAEVEIAFTLSPEDVAAYYEDWCAYYRTHRLDRKRTVHNIAWQGGWAAALIGLPLLIGLTTSSPEAGATAFIAVIACALFLAPRAFRWSAVRTMLRDRDLMAPHRLTVSEEGLSDCTDRMRWTRFWSGIQDVFATDRNILFVVESRGQPAAHTIPTRVFADAEQARRFVQLAGDLWRQSVPKDPPP